jgi:hypothetical protein
MLGVSALICQPEAVNASMEKPLDVPGEEASHGTPRSRQEAAQHSFDQARTAVRS